MTSDRARALSLPSASTAPADILLLAVDGRGVAPLVVLADGGRDATCTRVSGRDVDGR